MQKLEPQADKTPILTRSDTTIRLQVYLSHSGVCSRRNASKLIESEQVKVNNTIINIPGYRVNIYKDTIQVHNKICKLLPNQVYFMMNKPIKVESTNKSHTYDPNACDNRKTVKDIINKYYDKHIFSIGRLDYHSSGLLLFTTDGELSNRLMHPKYGIEKKYILETKNRVDDSILTQWLQGITINGITYTIYRFYRLNHKSHKIELILKEGKNREIRNVCEKFNILIKRLHRINIGPISIGNIKTGIVKPLTKREILLLYKSVKLQFPPK